MALRPVPHPASPQSARLRRANSPAKRRRATPKTRRRMLFSGLEHLEDRAMMAISIPVGGVVPVQDFNDLANTGTSSTMPTDWVFVESGTNANTTYAAGTGSSLTGDTYSFGTSSTDRALGGLRSGSLIPTFGASYVNNSGSPIASLSIAYNGEQYRLGTADRGPDRIDFQYSLDATSLATGTWIDVNALDFSSPITTGSTGGRFATAPVSSTISSLNIATGATFWIRWTDFDATGSDDGLAVDDFSLTAFAPANTNPTISNIADGQSTRSYQPISFTYTVGDAETPNNLELTGVSSNQSVVPNANIVVTGTGATRTVTVTPIVATTAAPITVTMTVRDGGNATAVDTFTLSVTQAPTLSISKTVTGDPGQSIIIPVRLNTNGNLLEDEPIEGIDIVLLYDTNVLTLRATSPPGPPPGPATIGGGLINDCDNLPDPDFRFCAGTWSVFGNSDEPGKLSITISTSQPLVGSFDGVIANIRATIKPTAPPGVSLLNMIKQTTIGGNTVNTYINEDNFSGNYPSLLLGPDPTSSPNDPVNDGFITVNGAAGQSPVNTVPAVPVSGTEDTNLALSGANLISVADGDSASVTTTVSVPNTAAGTFTATSGGGTVTPAFSNGNATVTFTGAPAQVNLALATLTFIPAANRNSTDGTLTVSVSTTDGTTTPDNDSFTISLTPINDAPSFTAANPAAVNEDVNGGVVSVPGFITSFSAGPTNEGAAGQTALNYLISNLVNPGLFSVAPTVATNGTLSYTLAPNAFGTATFDLRVQDNGGTAGGGVDTSLLPAQTITITVDPVNDAPSFTAGSNVTVPYNSSAYSASNWATNLSFGPANETGQTLSFVVLNDNTNLFDVQPAVSPAGTLTFTPKANTSGTANVTVRIVDTGGVLNGGVDTSATQPFTITISPPANQTPTNTFPAGPVAGTEDTNLPLSGANLISVADDSASVTTTVSVLNNTFGTFTATSGGGSVTPAFSNGGATVTFTGAPAQVNLALATLTFVPALHRNSTDGTLTVSVSTTDGTTTPDNDSFTISLTPVNDPPSFTASNPAAVNEDVNAGVVSVPGFITSFSPGPANETTEGQTVLSYLVSNVTNGTMFTVAPSVATNGTLSYTLAPNAFGTATFDLRVRDTGGTNGGGVDTSLLPAQTITITVNPVNDAPTYDIGNVSTRSFTPVTSAFTVADVEDVNGVTFSVVSSSNPTAFPVGNITFGGSGTNRTVTVLPAVGFSTPTTTTITVRATDAGGQTTDDTFVVTLTPAPTLRLGSVAGKAGDLIQVPILLSTNSTLSPGVLGVDIAVLYDTNYLQLLPTSPPGPGPGPVSPGGAGITAVGDGNDPGKIGISIGLDTPIAANVSNFQLGFLNFIVKATAPLGVTPVNMVPTTVISGNTITTQINEGGIELAPTPTSASNDPQNDGAVTVNAGTNNAPVNNFPVSPVVGFEDTNVGLAVTVSDANAGQNFVTVTVSVPNSTFGTFVTSPTASTAIVNSANGGAALTITGVEDQVNLVLGTLQFVPATNRNSDDGLITVTVQSNDTISTTTDNFQISLTPINDAPSFAIGGNQTAVNTAGQQTVANFATLISRGPTNESGQSVSFTRTSANSTLFSVQPAIAPDGTLTYTPAPGQTGFVTVTFTMSDDGGTNNGGINTTGPQSFLITVNAPANVSPVNTFPAGPVTGFEDTNLPLTGANLISVADDSASVTTTVAVPNNTFGTFLATNGGGSVTPAFSNGGATVTFTGSPAQVNLALATLTFVPALHRNLSDGTLTVSITSTDGATTPDSDSFNISLTAVNDAPTFTAGTPPTVLEDTLAPQSVPGFITAYSNGPANENLQALQGYLVSNISNTAFFATAPAVSNAGTLTYTLNPNVFGTVTFDLRAQDNGLTANSGVDMSAPQQITITVTGVNDQPTFTAGTPPTILEDAGPQTVGGFITAFSPGLNEATTQAIQAYLVSNISDASFFSSAPTVSNAGVLQYTVAPNRFGTATFELRAQDNGGTLNGGVDTSAMQLITITVTGVNDAPSITLGTAPAVLEDAVGTQSVPGFVTSFNPGPNESGQLPQSYQITNVSNPGLFASGPAIAANGTLTYTLNPNANGTSTFDVRVVDDGGTLNGGVNTSLAAVQGTINVTAVNDAPTFTAGTPPTVLEDTLAPQSVPGFITAYSNGPANENLQALQGYLVSNISNAAFFATPPAVSNAGTLTYALNPNMFGTVTFDLRAQDNGLTANGGVDTSGPQQITITVTGVNDAPSITLGTAPTVLEDAVGTQSVPGYVTSFNPGPNESGQLPQSYQITNVSNPSLFASGPSIAANGTLTYTLNPNANGTSTFDVRVVDDGGTANSGVNTSVAAVQGTINVTAVNDAPSFSHAGHQSVPFNSPAQTVNGFITAFSKGPADESGQTVTYTVTNDFPGLFAAGGEPAISPAGVLTYTPRTNTSGTAVVSVRIVDSGGVLNGGVDTSAIQTFNITVNSAVNTSPTNSSPAGPIAGFEDTNIPLTGPNLLSVADDSAAVTTVVSVPNSTFGTFTGNEGGGTVTMVFSDGNATVTIIGPASQVNLALATLVYVPVPDFNGTNAVVVTMSTTDGAFTDTDSFTINLAAVNDAPSFTKGANPTVNEDAGAQSVPGFITSFSPGPSNEAGQGVQAYTVANLTGAALFAVAPTVATNGTLSYTLNPNVSGVATFELRVRDNGGTADGGIDTSPPQIVTITVNAINDVPTFTAGTPPTILEDAGPQSVSGFITAFSPGPGNDSGQTIQAYQVANISIPGFFSSPPTVSTAGVLQYTVAANVFGSVTFDLRAQDNGGTASGGVDTSAPQTITITVMGVNDAPTFTAGAAPTILEDAGPQSVTGFITAFNPGPNEAATQAIGAYQVSNISNPSFFSSPPVVTTGGVLQYTVAANTSGSVTFDLRAQDNGGTANSGVDLSAPQLITITVTGVNDAPSITLGTAPTVLEDAPGTQTVAGYVTSFNPGANESGQTAQNYLIGNISNPSLFTSGPSIAPNGTLTYTLAANANGTSTFEVRGVDNGGVANGGVDTSAIMTGTINVTAVNDAPSFAAGTPPTVLEDAAAQTVTGFITSFSPGPANENGQAVQAYQVSNISNAAFFQTPPAVSNTGTLTYTLNSNVSGTVTFELRAQDNGGTANSGVDTSAPQTITITVTGVNDAPSFTAGTPPTILEDAGPQSVNGFITAFNPGPNESSQGIQAYLVSNISNPSFFSAAPTVSNAGVLQYTVAPNVFGTVTFELRAQDNGGTANSGVDTSAAQTITINVTGVNDPPSIILGVAPAVLEDAAGPQTVPGYITGFNPGPNESGQVVQGYLIANVSNPSLFASGPSIAADGTLSYTLAANANGASTFEIRVVDSGGTANGGVDTSTAITGSINVTAVNDVPTFTVGPNQTVAYNAPAQTVSGFIPTFSPGPANESLQTVSFTVTNDFNGLFTAGGQPAISPSGVLTYTPRPNTSGTATVSVQIVDSGDTLNGGQNTSAVQTFTITVSEAPVNAPPTIDTPATVTILEDAGLQTVSLTGISAGGSETQALTITASSADPLIIPTPTVIYTTGTTGSLTFTPVPNAHGSTTITITVRDAGFDGQPNNSDDATRQVSFTVNVTAVNDIPTFAAGTPPTVLEDAPAQSLNGFITSFSPGPNEATQAVQGYLVSNISNPSFFAVAPAVSTAGTLTYTLAPNANGSVTFELRAQDNGGTANSGVDTSAPQTITINVTPVNDAPSFTATNPPAISEDAPQQVINNFATGFSPGPANESAQGLAAYLVSNISNPAFFAVAPAVASNGTLTYTVAAGVSGTVTFDLRAQDNGGTANGGIDTSPAQTITINVAGVNDAPSFTAGTPPTVLEDAPAQTVNGFITSFSPGAGEASQAIQAYLVSNISNPAFFAVPPAVSNTGTLTYTLAANANGTVTFELRAQDNGGTANGGVDTSAPQLITLTVTPVNDAPTVTTITPPTVVEDAPQQVVSNFATFSPGPANESAQGLAAFVVSNISNPAFFAVAPAVASNGTLTYTLAPNMSGTVTFDLQAQDNGGTANGGVNMSAVQTVTITVTGVNDAPSFTAGTPPTVLEDAPAQTVNGFITSFSPGPGESSQAVQAYLVSNISNPAFFTVAPAVSNTGTLTYTLAPNVNGTVTFEVRAQDNGGTAGGGVDTSAPQTIALTVTPVNDAPSLTLGTAPTVLEDAAAQTVNGYVTSFSPGPNESSQAIQSYTVSNVSNPSLFASGPTIANNGSLSYTLAANANGSSTFEVRAVDNGGTANGGVNTSAPVIGTITVTPVNDAPSFALSANPTIAYNSPAQTSAGFATTISRGPADESGQTLGFNVSVTSNPSLFLVAPSIAPNGTLTYTPAANVSGTATINVSLTDNGGTASGGVDTSAVRQFTITIQPAPVNNPPTISSIGNVVISEDAGPQTVNFSGVTTGGETETLTVTASSSDPTIVPNPSVTYFSPQATGSLNFTPVANTNGTVTITVTVRDPGLDTIPGNSDDGITSTTFTVTITPVNDLPSFTVGANQTVNEDSGLQTVNSWASNISAGPPNESSQVLTFNIVGNSNPTLFSSAPTISSTGVLSYTPAPNANGSATISVTLSDNAGGTTGVQTFQITVSPVNDAPSFVVGANQSVSEDAGPQTAPNWATSISAGPADESSQSLTFNISGNSNPSLFSVQPTVLPNGTLSYTPAANATGTATITLNVADNGGTANGGVDASGSQTFTITVNQVNDPPSFVAGPSQTVLEDAGPQTVNSWASGISVGPANEAGQTVSFNIVGISNPSLFSAAPAISPTGVLTYTPAPNANGSATITVSLSDNGGGTNTSPTQTFQISVTPVNDAPSFVAGANQAVNEDAGPQTVPGWATALSAGPLDEAGQSLTFQVTGNTNPSLFASAPQVQSNGTLTYTPAANASGSATITLNVMDNGGTANGGVNASSSQTFTITVNAVNDPPSFVRGANQIVNEDAGPQTVSSWATSLSAGPANEAGQTLSFTVTNNTNTSLFSTQPAISPTGVLTYTPAANANGTATISIQLNDSAGGTSAVQTFTITVQPVNDAPSFTVGPNQTTTEDSGNQTVSGWATGISAGPADESSQSLTFVVIGNTNAGLFSTPPSVTPAGTLSYTPAANASGSATITLVLQDSGGTTGGGVNVSTAHTFTISVTPVNDPPDATDSQFNTVVDTPVSGTVSVSDPDGPTLTYSLQMLPVLGTVTSFNTSTGQFTYTPTPGATGLDLFTFSVSDGTTTDTATVRIVIGANTPIVIPSGGNLQVIGTGNRDTVIVSPGPAGQVLVRTDAGGVSSSGYYPLTGTISVSTGDGDDYVVVSGVTNATTVDAGSGNDYVSTGVGDDVIIGGTGDDRINASSGNNIVWGDEIGQQDLVIGGNDILSSLGGNDVMYGGGGDDQLYPGAGDDYVYAGQGHDLVSSGAGNDRIFGGAGNDTLVGDGGDDVISGGEGNDYILGSEGHDVIIGGTGNDSIDGGGGNDLLIAGDTNNSVSSQTGDTNDVALMALLAAWNATHAAGIANGIVLGDDGANDSLTGGTGDDDFYALASDVLNNFNATGMGTDRRFP